ncbi:unnamed protein product, partial [Tetraodon nigroviridis]
ESSLDFLVDFVEMSQGPVQAFAALETRPRSGVNVSLLLTGSGNDSLTLTEVSLVKLLGTEEVIGTVTAQESGSFLVEFQAPPPGVSWCRSSNLTIAVSSSRQHLCQPADSNGVIAPGTPFPVPFSVKSYGLGGNFTVRATNSRLYNLTYPSSLNLNAGESSNGTVTIMATGDIPSGTDVTLTIEVEAPGGQDANYAVLRFSVINPVTLPIPSDSFPTLFLMVSVSFGVGFDGLGVLITLTLPGERRHASRVSADQPERQLPPRLQRLQVDALRPGAGRDRGDGRRQCDAKNRKRDPKRQLRNDNA